MKTPTQILGAAELKKKISGLKRSLTARARRKNTPAAYQCVGGPFDGEVIYLETSSTGSFRVGEMLGKYEAEGGLCYRGPRSVSQIQWKVAA